MIMLALVEHFSLVNKLVNDYGCFFRVWIGLNLGIFASDSKDVEILLSSPRYIDKSGNYKFFRPWLNDGLLLSNGKKWHSRRKVITPAFHFNALKQFVEVFDRMGDTFIRKLDTFKSTDKVDLYSIIKLYTLDVICETAMGVFINALSQPDSEYVRAVEQISNVVQIRVFNFVYRIPFIFERSELGRQQEVALNVLHGFADDVIRRRRLELLESKIANKQTNGDDTTHRRTFLDLLLESQIDGKLLTDLEIREEVDTFMFAGHDTTASATTFLLYNIAKYPAIQKRCFEEIVDVLGPTDSEPVTFSQLNQMPYLEATVKETLRMFPSAPVISRLATEDITLTNNRVIPSGATVIIPIFAMGRNENVFEDANQFNPDRFLESRSNERQNPFSYIPFSAGPRNCIGQKYAMYEIKCIVSKLLRHFEFDLHQENKDTLILSTEVVLRPEKPIKFYLKRRNI